MRSEVMDFSRYDDRNRHSSSGRHGGRASRVAGLAALALGALGVAWSARADNPGYDRPGYGFTPIVLAAGDVTVEQGLPDGSHDRQNGVTRAQYTADSLLRLGLGGPLELQWGSSPWNELRQTSTADTRVTHGHGDSQLGLKLALPSPNPAFSWGLLGSVEFTDGAKDFRSDRRQYLLGAQFNVQASARHALGAYLEDVRSGGASSTTLAIGDSYALRRTLTVYVETAWLHAADQGSGAVTGAGLAWMITPRVQLDAGCDRRLGGTAPAWQTHLGMAAYFGH
jgi:hypothetical protein